MLVSDLINCMVIRVGKNRTDSPTIVEDIECVHRFAHRDMD